MKKVLAFLLSALLLSSSLVSCKKETTTKDEANFSDPTLGDTTTVDEYIDYLAEKNIFRYNKDITQRTAVEDRMKRRILKWVSL